MLTLHAFVLCYLMGFSVHRVLSFQVEVLTALYKWSSETAQIRYGSWLWLYHSKLRDSFFLSAISSKKMWLLIKREKNSVFQNCPGGPYARSLASLLLQRNTLISEELILNKTKDFPEVNYLFLRVWLIPVKFGLFSGSHSFKNNFLGLKWYNCIFMHLFFSFRIFWLQLRVHTHE